MESNREAHCTGSTNCVSRQPQNKSILILDYLLKNCIYQSGSGEAADHHMRIWHVRDRALSKSAEMRTGVLPADDSSDEALLDAEGNPKRPDISMLGTR